MRRGQVFTIQGITVREAVGVPDGMMILVSPGVIEKLDVTWRDGGATVKGIVRLDRIGVIFNLDVQETVG